MDSGCVVDVVNGLECVAVSRRRFFLFPVLLHYSPDNHLTTCLQVNGRFIALTDLVCLLSSPACIPPSTNKTLSFFVDLRTLSTFYYSTWTFELLLPAVSYCFGSMPAQSHSHTNLHALNTKMTLVQFAGKNQRRWRVMYVNVARANPEPEVVADECSSSCQY